jgi:ABC-type transporter Mla subunit MlaD
MTESEAFQRLQRENRRWKGIALGACSVVVLIVIAWLVDGSVHRLRAEAQATRVLAEVEALRARAETERAIAEARRAEAAARERAAAINQP